MSNFYMNGLQMQDILLHFYKKSLLCLCFILIEEVILMKEIDLNNKSKKNEGKFKAFVDDDLFKEVNRFNWYYHNKGYAVRYDCSADKPKSILLHRYIYELKYGEIPEGYFVDHIDRNPLNNQISNLRLVTPAENCCNISKYRNNKSGYIGVSKKVNKQKNKNGTIWKKEYWDCQWYDNNSKQRHKYFPFDNIGKVRAARYRDLMVKQIYGDFCGELNFSSLEDYQKALKQAILKDLEEN